MTTVNIITDFCDEEDGITYWTMKFVFKAGDLTNLFWILKPHAESKANWLALAEGEFHMDSLPEDGSIVPCDDDKLKFTGLHNDNGDSHSVISIPRLLVANKLKATIEEADTLGYSFAE